MEFSTSKNKMVIYRVTVTHNSQLDWIHYYILQTAQREVCLHLFRKQEWALYVERLNIKSITQIIANTMQTIDIITLWHIYNYMLLDGIILWHILLTCH